MKNSCLIAESEEDDNIVDIDSHMIYIIIDKGISCGGYGSVITITCILEDWKSIESEIAKKSLLLLT